MLLTEYFDIQGRENHRLGYMTTLIYSGVALVTGYLFLYDSDGIMTTWLSGFSPTWTRLVFWLHSRFVIDDVRLLKQSRAVPAQRHPRD